MRQRERDIATAKWRHTLKPGDYSYVTFYNSAYVHISRLRDPKTDNKDRSLWSSRALCGVGRKYYSRPMFIGAQRSEHSYERCKRCLASWRALGSPALNEPKQSTTPSGIWLAFGWHEVPVVGIEFDLGKDGDPTKTVDDAGKVWGEKRTERQRWQRGDRYVRICELFADSDGYRFVVRYGIIGDSKSDHWQLKGSLKSCIDRASRLMALGGMPE